MADSMPIELPVFAVIREGSSLKPSLRIVGRVNGQPVNVPASDKAKALAAVERLLPAFVQSAGSIGLKAAEDPLPSEPSLSDLFAAVQVLIVNSEHVNTRLAAIEEHLAGVTSETPPAPPAPADDDAEFWAQFLAAADPDPETFAAESFETYSRGRVLYQWRAQYTPTGKRTYTPVDHYMGLIRDMYADPDHPASQAFRAEGLGFEDAVYAVLSGRVDDLVGRVELGTRWLEKVRSLGKHNAEWMFQRDIAGAVAGGNAGQGGEG